VSKQEKWIIMDLRNIS